MKSSLSMELPGAKVSIIRSTENIPSLTSLEYIFPFFEDFSFTACIDDSFGLSDSFTETSRPSGCNDLTKFSKSLILASRFSRSS